MAARTPHPVNKKSTILPFKAGEHLYEVSLRHIMRTEGERQKSIKVVNSRIMNQRNLIIPGIFYMNLRSAINCSLSVHICE